MDPRQLNGDCTPNLAEENLGPLIGTLGWIEAVIAIKIMVARFLVQKMIVGRVGRNDWVMLLALVSVPSGQ